MYLTVSRLVTSRVVNPKFTCFTGKNVPEEARVLVVEPADNLADLLVRGVSRWQFARVNLRAHISQCIPVVSMRLSGGSSALVVVEVVVVAIYDGEHFAQ